MVRPWDLMMTKGTLLAFASANEAASVTRAICATVSAVTGGFGASSRQHGSSSLAAPVALQRALVGNTDEIPVQQVSLVGRRSRCTMGGLAVGCHAVHVREWEGGACGFLS